jgi:hypothetical protein
MIKIKNITETLTNPVFYLILSNLFVLIFALVYSWNIGEIIWIFLIQNLIIGFFNFLRIVQNKTRMIFGVFFLMHYGGFQLAYMILLFSMFKNVNALHVLISGALFIMPHFLSYRQKLKYDRNDVISLTRLMNVPYLRIIPMHIIIFVAAALGTENKLTLAAFLILKTIVDVKMHLVERKLNEEPSISMCKAIKNGTRKT